MSNKMKVDLSGKTAIVTGAGGVIGKAISLALAANGAKVVLTGRSRGPLEIVENEIKAAGGECTIIQSDISDKAKIQNLVDETLKTYGSIDILVNNAGVNGNQAQRVNFWEYDDELFDKIIATDLNGVYYLSKPVAAQMVKQGSGSIINVASVTGLVPLRLQCAYCAAKAGVINLTKAMAIEIADKGVRVNAIAPGSVLNEQLKEVFYNDKQRSEAMLSHIPMHRTGETEEEAAMVCFLASDDASYITGSVNTIDGGWSVGYSRDF